MNNTNVSNNNEDTAKTSKSSKTKSKRTALKSRNKAPKSEGNNTITSKYGICSNGSGEINNTSQNLSNTPITAATAATPSLKGSGGMFDNSTGGGGIGSSGDNNESLTISRSHHKNYTGLEPRSIKIIWEQHDQSDLELSHDVCARVAEDASYKLWQLVNVSKFLFKMPPNRHSGGRVTYDLVNEVLKDMDVPPCLGAMDSDWDQIEYDGSYFFPSDKILELRDEYQKDVTYTIPHGPDFECIFPVEEKRTQIIKEYMPSLLDVMIHGSADDLDAVLVEAAFSPIIGSCFCLLLTKIIQIMAFKQSQYVIERCWSVLQALSTNPRSRHVSCRIQYFHLSELLICQLMAPYEKIKVQKPADEQNIIGQDQTPTETVKDDNDFDLKCENMEKEEATVNIDPPEVIEVIYNVCDDGEEESVDEQTTSHGETSPYFAPPVDWKHVDDLCRTLSHLSIRNGYFQSECIHHILKRLQRFFEGRTINCERDYNYISRSVRGLFALGECAFRQFIPFIFQMESDNLPETLWNYFAMLGIFLCDSEDIFLYEWLQNVCGDMCQPFLIYYADYYENFVKYCYLGRKRATFKLVPKIGVRRLEWSTIAAAMCHGDDPNKALKPKPSLHEMFPHLIAPNLQLNRAGNIRFKFAGCNPIIIKGKLKLSMHTTSTEKIMERTRCPLTHDILIAKRKLHKPITNEKIMIPSYSYYYLRC